jgi:hypothetical protein
MVARMRGGLLLFYLAPRTNCELRTQLPASSYLAPRLLVLVLVLVCRLLLACCLLAPVGALSFLVASGACGCRWHPPIYMAKARGALFVLAVREWFIAQLNCNSPCVRSALTSPSLSSWALRELGYDLLLCLSLLLRWSA